MYCVNYSIIPFQNLSLTFILKSFLFLAGTRLRIGEKGEKKTAWAWQKKKKKEQRGSLERGKVSLEKTVCMQRSHGARSLVEPQSVEEEGKGGGRPSPSPGHRSARFAFRYFSYLTKFFSHCGAWCQVFLFSGLTNNREL